MRDETVARNYAEALFEIANRDDQLEAYGDAMETVARILAENPTARLFLETPRIDADDKKRVLGEVLSDVMPRKVLNFVRLTIDKRRQRLLQDISRSYHDLLDEHLGRAHVEVTVARKFSDEDIRSLAGWLSEMLGKRAVTHVRIKPEILGGVMVKAGDTVYDGTLRRRLDGMRRSMLSAHLPDPSAQAGPAQAG